MRFDGRAVPVQDGDTIASALHREGILEISRSLKYHRPRGLYCNTGSCASCFVDVDGVPNVPACMRAAEEGLDVSSQNTMGGAKRDLFAVTDKVYRRGFDPHAAFTGNRLLNAAFMKAVRFMSGQGKAPHPDTQTAAATYVEKHVDVLVIGGGLHGLRAAKESKGDVLLVEELPELGGSGLWSPEPDTDALIPDVVGHATVWTEAVAFGIYDDVVGITKGGDLYAVTAKHLIIAPGRHDAWPLFENNDLPGVLSLRGASRLLAQGALPGKRVVAHGGPLPAAFMERLQAAGGQVVAEGNVEAARGGTRVEKARVGDAWVRCDTIICHLIGTPRIELFQQAGCELAFKDGVLSPVTNGHGRTTRKDIQWGHAHMAVA